MNDNGPVGSPVTVPPFGKVQIVGAEALWGAGWIIAEAPFAKRSSRRGKAFLACGLAFARCSGKWIFVNGSAELVDELHEVGLMEAPSSLAA